MNCIHVWSSRGTFYAHKHLYSSFTYVTFTNTIFVCLLQATILMNALKNCGRSDLAHLLNERQQLALSSRQASARRSVRIEDDEDPVFS